MRIYARTYVIYIYVRLLLSVLRLAGAGKFFLIKVCVCFHRSGQQRPQRHNNLIFNSPFLDNHSLMDTFNLSFRVTLY
jgi:hypothetical protein